MLNDFTEDIGERDGTVIKRVYFISLLDNGEYISFFPGGWKLTYIKLSLKDQLLDKALQDCWF